MQYPLSIRARLIALGLLAVGALVLVGGLGSLSVSQLRDQFGAFAEHEFITQGRLTTLRMGMGDIRRYEKDVLLSIDEVDKAQQYQEKWAKSVRATQAVLQQLQAGGQCTDCPKIAAHLKDYETAAAEVIQRTINGQIVTAPDANQQMATAKKAMYQAEPLLDQLATRVQKAAEDRTADVRALATTQLALTGGLALLVLGVLVPALWVTVRSILQPLEQAIAIAHRVADGDLSQRIAVQGSREVAALLGALSSMQASLRALVTDVQQAAEAIDTASAEVAQGSQDLSQRSEQAAADLQQTASAVAQLTEAVNDSERAASEVAGLARQSAQAAHKGGEIVFSVVTSMSHIAKGSDQIAQITGVIDAIAFQTNLLALNAAVEAARAGEQGRGFAVVAAEVRQLAQRSAEAAREINSLVRSATEHVGSGGQLARDAGAEMKAIIATIDRVSTMMSDMNQRLTEQAQGLSLLNRSVGDLDALTQQNAALVEESAASAASLRDQAHGLLRTAGHFRVQSV